MRPAFTGSSAERALACPASQALPWATKPPGEAANRGTAIHAFLADVGKLGREAALARVEEKWRDTCARLDLDGLPLDAASFASEVSFAYHPETDTARELGRDLGRDYSGLLPGEIPITVDSVGINRPFVMVSDWKSGFVPVTAAYKNPQLKLGALAAARTYGCSGATVLIAYPREDEPAITDRVEFDPWDLDGFAEEFAAGQARVFEARAQLAAGQEPDVNMGPHCEHCPVRACPGHLAMIRAVTSSPAEFKNSLLDQLTPATAALAYDKWKMAHEALGRVGAALYEWAKAHPIELGDGVVFGPKVTTRHYVDGVQAWEALASLHGNAVADRAVTLESSKAAIKEALRSVAAATGKPLAQLEREVLAVIQDRGGIEKRTTSTVKEHRPKKGEEADGP